MFKKPTRQIYVCLYYCYIQWCHAVFAPYGIESILCLHSLFYSFLLCYLLWKKSKLITHFIESISFYFPVLTYSFNFSYAPSSLYALSCLKSCCHLNATICSHSFIHYYSTRIICAFFKSLNRRLFPIYTLSAASYLASSASCISCWCSVSSGAPINAAFGLKIL